MIILIKTLIIFTILLLGTVGVRIVINMTLNWFANRREQMIKDNIKKRY